MRYRPPTADRVVAHVLFEPHPAPVGVRPHSAAYYRATTPTPAVRRRAVELLAAAGFEVESQTGYSAVIAARPEVFEARFGSRLRVVDGFWDWQSPPVVPGAWGGVVRGVVLPGPAEEVPL